MTNAPEAACRARKRAALSDWVMDIEWILREATLPFRAPRPSFASSRDLDAVVGAVGEDLEGGAVARREPARSLAPGFEGELAGGDLRVQAGVAPAGRVGIGQADERRGGCMEACLETR